MSATDSTLPRRQDLSDFWEHIERAVSGLGSSISIADFDASHIRAIAPLILGQHAWSVVRGSLSDGNGLQDWRTLKKIVEARFGLPRKALIDAFYNMRIAEGQELGSFILHVEDMHAHLNIDRDSCFRIHAPRLEQAGLINLDSFGDYAALMVGPEYADFEWDNLLQLAQHRDMKVKCKPDGAPNLTGFGPPAVTDPQPGAVAV